jgi:uncharacterized protein YndB with AHSA1/START domain
MNRQDAKSLVHYQETTGMEKIAVERSIWIAAPRQRVWQAVTEPEQIPQWLFPALPGALMKRDDSGKLSMSMGPMDADVAVLEDMNSPRQVTSRGLPDRLLATTYTLDEEKDGTRITVTMTGFEALPEDERRDRLNLSGAAWEQTLENLKAHVAGEALPYPYASVASLFGYWREVKEKVLVERSIWIHAPRERVWQAITDPAQVEQWFSPGTQWRGTGLKVGGRLSVYNAETDSDMYVQVIEAVDPLYQLVTRSEPEPGETPTTTTWNLREENNGTRLTLIYSGYELMPVETRNQQMEQNTFGFGMMMANLKAVIEGESLPFPGGF